MSSDSRFFTISVHFRGGETPFHIECSKSLFDLQVLIALQTGIIIQRQHLYRGSPHQLSANKSLKQFDAHATPIDSILGNWAILTLEIEEPKLQQTQHKEKEGKQESNNENENKTEMIDHLSHPIAVKADWSHILQRSKTSTETDKERIEQTMSRAILKESVVSGIEDIYLLRHVLSENECAEIIQNCISHGFDNLGSTSYRLNRRLITEDPSLAHVIYQRIRPFLPKRILLRNFDDKFISQSHNENSNNSNDAKIVYEWFSCESHKTEKNSVELSSHNKKDVDNDKLNESIWEVCGLNECFRYCEYSADAFFAKHIDTYFQRCSAEMSFFTVNIYLNGGFGDGCTRFFLEEHKQNFSATHSVVPCSGLALLFNHFPREYVHDGDIVRQNFKYLMRTDVMYRKLST